IGPVLEIEQRVPLNRYSTRLALYRLPAPENAEADVARVAERYRVQAVTETRSVRQLAWGTLVVVVGALIWIVIWAISVAKRG
ncbi:MAG: hypothetical protein ABIZ81_14635, partial [Opitutaceae bacterium]